LHTIGDKISIVIRMKVDVLYTVLRVEKVDEFKYLDSVVF